MKTLLRLFAIFLLLVAPRFGIVLTAFSSYDLSYLESQISPESSNEKIIKLQTLFKEFGLYNGEITGIYDDIKDVLIDYQIKSKIINNRDDYGAGHFGIKTLIALKKDFPSKFEENKNIITLEEPEFGERNFIVTAYYSPLPNQKKYITGSYAGDIKLNGNGKHTASGKKVFAGLLAAPKNYLFGTEIELDGIGIGRVEDRGGAILNAGEKGHEYDRIDVWMGYGDEGLARAMKWGKRTVKGRILEIDEPVKVAFGDYVILEYDDLRVTPESKKEDIIRLQELFKKLEIYSSEITGVYEDIKNDLINFQLDNDIIKSANEEEAGYFGPKTIIALRERYPGEIFRPYEFRDDYSGNIKDSLSLKEKNDLKILRDNLVTYINKQSRGNLYKKEKYKNTINKKINDHILNTNDSKRKIKLEYIMKIL